jgi:hypothetical protein
MLEVRRHCDHPDNVARSEKPSRGILDPVARVLRLPFGTPDFIDRIIRGGANQAGRLTLQTLITTWDATGGGPFAASAIAGAGLAKTVEIFDPLLKALGADQITLRAALCSSQVVGLGIMRYVVRVEPIQSMDVNALVDAVAPTLQRYLVGEIS